MGELLTVKEVSEVLKTNVTYVHKLRKAGLLPFLKIGCYKCRREALDEFLRTYECYDLTNPDDIRRMECKCSNQSHRLNG